MSALDCRCPLLIDGENTLGVLQVLDKHTSPTFSLRDMELLAVFARQAAAAIRASRVQRDTTRLFQAVLARIGAADDDGAETLSEESVEAVVSAITAGLDNDEECRSGSSWIVFAAARHVRP